MTGDPQAPSVFWQCDYPGCHDDWVADCGGVNDETDNSCAGSFCARHLHVVLDPPNDICGEVCASCKDKIEANAKEL